MKMYFQGRIKIVEEIDFVAASGDAVRYTSYTIQGENKDAIKVNSKKDFHLLQDVLCDFSVDILPEPATKFFRVSNLDAKPVDVDKQDA